MPCPSPRVGRPTPLLNGATEARPGGGRRETYDAHSPERAGRCRHSQHPVGRGGSAARRLSPKATMRCLALPLLLTLAACAPSVQSATFGPDRLPARAAGSPVQIFQQTRPTCAVQEIGWVSAHPSDRFSSGDDLLDALRARARAMGGDAIVGLVPSDRAHGAVVAGGPNAGAVAISNATGFGGTVVRFADARCTS